MRKAITILAMVCISLSTVSVQAAQSTFDTDAEGWSMMCLRTFGNPPTGYPGSAFWWESATGNPGGCIRLTEYAGPNDTFKAPAEYLGNKSSAFGTNLTFDLWTSRGTSSEENFIALVGSSTTLYYKSAVNGGSWNQFQIPLVGSGWKKDSHLGPDATDDDMLNVLGNVTALYIWGDFTGSGSEYSRLDNVFMAEAPVERSVEIDIKPQSCPNPLNFKSKGVLSVAILGTEDFDASTIDADSITLADVSPIHHSYEDVATPVSDGADDCECTTEGPDGYLDFTLKFKIQEIVAALGEVDDGDILSLTLTGLLFDGTSIEGADCVVIIKKGSKKK